MSHVKLFYQEAEANKPPVCPCQGLGIHAVAKLLVWAWCSARQLLFGRGVVLNSIRCYAMQIIDGFYMDELRHVANPQAEWISLPRPASPRCPQCLPHSFSANRLPYCSVPRYEYVEEIASRRSVVPPPGSYPCVQTPIPWQAYRPNAHEQLQRCRQRQAALEPPRARG